MLMFGKKSGLLEREDLLACSAANRKGGLYVVQQEHLNQIAFDIDMTDQHKTVLAAGSYGCIFKLIKIDDLRNKSLA